MSAFALLLVLIHHIFIIRFPLAESTSHDYREALSKCILFFEGQRSGYLPHNQRLTWRKDSAIHDGKEANVDLVGGYYDAGDNVKFGFPMAFTATMLAWSLIEFGESFPSDEHSNAMMALKWATDYLLKAAAHGNQIFTQVGDPNEDHNCWQRPEDMDTPRTVYSVDASNPGSEVAGETAAALAAASIVFRRHDKDYSKKLLKAAIKVFKFADMHRGSYSSNPKTKNAICPFYCDFSGYKDELLWGAAWLRSATMQKSFLDYIVNNSMQFGKDPSINEFGWDDKHAGVSVLLSRDYLLENISRLSPFKASADGFICSLLPKSDSPSHIKYTAGGLMYKSGGSNMQHVTSSSFLLLVHANSLSRSSQEVSCGGGRFSPDVLRQLAKQQVDYILGDNPQKMSYMVGYGESYPQHIHHRASSLPSLTNHPDFIPCKEGTKYFKSNSGNPNVLVGALVGGPGEDDAYKDERADFAKSEPTTYINAPIVGVLAYFVAHLN